MPKATIEPLNVTEGVIVKLTLDQIALDPVTDVRIGEPSKDEPAKIEALAKTIFEEGQLQPIVVRPDSAPDMYRVMAGRRRLAAKKLIQEKSGSPVTIDAIIVKKSDSDAFKAAIIENLQREDFTPMQKLALIEKTKEHLNATGKDWTKHVAEFLSVSRANISETMRLKDLPDDLRAKCAAGLYTASGAIEIAKQRETARAEVAARAEALAKAEQQAKRAAERAKRESEVAKGRKGAENRSGAAKSAKSEASDKPSSPKKSGGSDEKVKVGAGHVRRAARELEVEDRQRARTKHDILAFFQPLAGPESGYAEELEDFAKVFVEKWATGELTTDRPLLNRWDAISQLIDKKSRRKAS